MPSKRVRVRCQVIQKLILFFLLRHLSFYYCIIITNLFTFHQIFACKTIDKNQRKQCSSPYISIKYYNEIHSREMYITILQHLISILPQNLLTF